MREYHDRFDSQVPALRISMPINLRTETTADRAGNQFVPVRFLVPLDIDDPAARMTAIRELVEQQRDEPALPIVDEIASAADLVMGKAKGVAVAIVRGLEPTWFGRGSVVDEIVRDPAEDLFR